MAWKPPAAGKVLLSLGSKYQVQSGMGSYSLPLPRADPVGVADPRLCRGLLSSWKGEGPCGGWPRTLSFLRQGSGWEKPQGPGKYPDRSVETAALRESYLGVATATIAV